MQTVGESQRKKSEPATVKKKKTPEGAKRQFVEELEQKAGEEFGHHIERLKMIPFEAKATSTAAAYKAENDKRNSWISQKKLPMDESSFLFYLLDRAKQIGSSALAKISAAYQTANEGISAIGASFVSDIIKSKRREESLLEKEVVKTRSSFFNYEPGSDADILMCRWRLRTKGKCPYVFSHLDGSKKLSKQAISTLSTKMLAAIGKPGATHHCFRRGGANNMRRIGHSMEEIQCRGRWRSAAGLQRYLTDVPIAQGCLQSQAESDDEEK
ncbi:Protein CBG24870 [Caenorhabditis briggsae]|uniref:Protein CBG24870 n=1 Tax=Caenorhabditis briggsae TaxID=6238 RepID=A8WLN4_CAEBR|nr:Protein CBG24870 [Caenorhabditis briggsae]CAP21380.1 Protein CBG24870 [Caenorhabditis briggsae]